MVATSDSLDGHHPRSRRVYAQGKLHPEVQVPMREIDLSPTKSLSGAEEINQPVRIYDCSGPWGDPAIDGDVEQGLPPLRNKWIKGRGDVEEYPGRTHKPGDDGYLSGRHVEHVALKDREQYRVFPGLRRKPLRAKGQPITQLWYARQGIVTPEMEFIAIRENFGREQAMELTENKQGARNVLNQQHPGRNFHGWQ
jgi:phosphomethylpyrimidine synthase